MRCQPFAIVNQRIAVRVIAATTSLAVQQPAADIGVLKRTSIFVLELVGATAPAAVAQALPFGFAHFNERLTFPEWAIVVVVHAHGLQSSISGLLNFL